MRSWLRWSMVFAVLAGMVALNYACDDDDDDDGRQIQSATVTVIATEFAFTPSQITATAGSNLTVILLNEGTTPHALAFDLPGGVVTMTEAVTPGETRELTFTVPEQVGDYTFFSPVNGDAALGMRGTLTVTEAVGTGTGTSIGTVAGTAPGTAIDIGTASGSSFPPAAY